MSEPDSVARQAARTLPCVRSLVLLAACAALLAASPANAGSLGDFRDSVRPSRSSGSSAPRDDDDSRRDGGSRWDDDDDAWDDSPGATLIGAVFQGIGDAIAADAASGRDEGTTPRLTLRLESNLLTDGSAGGFGLFAMIDAERMPGLALWHTQLFDPRARERLGLTELTVELPIVDRPRGRIAWHFGGVLYGGEGGLVNGGGQGGVSLDAFPLPRWGVHTRFGVQLMVAAQAADVYLGTSVRVSDRSAILLGYRGLAGTTSPLHIGTIGVSVTLGQRRTAPPQWQGGAMAAAPTPEAAPSARPSDNLSERPPGR